MPYCVVQQFFANSHYPFYYNNFFVVAMFALCYPTCNYNNMIMDEL